MRKADAAGITPDQPRILALLDSGLSHTEVAERLDMPPPAVTGRRVAHVRDKVPPGTYAPPLLPLEAAALIESHQRIRLLRAPPPRSCARALGLAPTRRSCPVKD